MESLLILNATILELISARASKGILKCLQMANVSDKVISVSHLNLLYTESSEIFSSSLNSSARLMWVAVERFRSSMKFDWMASMFLRFSVKVEKNCCKKCNFFINRSIFYNIQLTVFHLKGSVGDVG